MLKRFTDYFDITLKISELINNNEDIDMLLDNILTEIGKLKGIKKGIITIFNSEKNEIKIEKAAGITRDQMAKGRYKIGEGIIGRVVESKKPVIIPDISLEPNFLNKTKSINNDEKISFFCVPIKYKNEVVGTISIDKEIESNDSPVDFSKILILIAFLISEETRILKLEREKDHENILKLIEENMKLKIELNNTKFHPANIIGSSKEMKEVYSLIEKVSKSNANVLLLGESGVGKEVVANAIHSNSLRKDSNFIKINCAAIPETLIESELFGHEKGAFTGAVFSRKGKFELADKGTIFLDEITEVSLGIQVKLLRVIQEREIEVVGGGVKTIDVRIIAASNKDITEAVKENKFREDLFYRLNVFPINIPPLRNRKSDILLLANFFVEKYCKINDKIIRRISTPAIDMLISYHWPGNVRELENVIERAIILSSDGVIHSYHLPPTLQTAEGTNTGYKTVLQKKLDAVEYEMIIEALKESKGNMCNAAKELGITERMIGIRMEKYKIDYRIFRQCKYDDKLI